jgi:histidine ammonia-lyase
MATHGAAKARRVAGNAGGVVGIELLAAVQGNDFHAPLRSSPRLTETVSAVRRHVPHYASDRYLADDLAWAKEAVLSGSIAEDMRSRIFTDA